MANRKNPYLKKANEQLEYSPEQIQELARCMKDPEYFIHNYCQIQTATQGSIPFHLRPYQQRIVNTLANNRLAIVLASRQVGKCVTGDTIITVAKVPTGVRGLVFRMVGQYKSSTNSVVSKVCKAVSNLMVTPYETTIQQLHDTKIPYICRVNDTAGNLKFIQKGLHTDDLVLTPTGYSPINTSMLTVPYDIWELKTENYTLKCADNHIVIGEDGTEIMCQQLLAGVSRIRTVTGIETVLSVARTSSNPVSMYDLSIDDDDHVYYTNGILSHNSWIAGAFLLWYAIFKFEQTVVIASNKNDNAMEMIHRVRFIYERLPHWLKPGLADDGWNKHNVGFDNGSRIISQATSENTGRGLAISLLFLDEFAFVRDAIADEFWGSVSPTLATGGKCVICSTPNGDTNTFAQLWRGANIPSELNELVGINGFAPLEVKWDDPPGRDAAFKASEIGKIGEIRWSQEYECLAGDGVVEIQDEHGNTKLMTLLELFETMNIDTIAE